jgi:hypothetical protein
MLAEEPEANIFFHQVNARIDWTFFEKEIYKVCNRSLKMKQWGLLRILWS